MTKATRVPYQYDVIVVGGGPAGASAAREAAHHGLSTLLLDAARFPRNKPCGGALSEQAMSYLNFRVPRRLQEADVFGARVHLGANTITATLDERIATIVSRSNFDTFLLEQATSAGARVIQQCRVSDVTEQRTHVEVTDGNRTFTAAYCVICAGATSSLPDRIRPRPTKKEYALAVELDVPAATDTVQSYSDGLIDIYFGVVERGYGWVFPHRGRFNVGLGGIAATFSRAPRALDAFVTTLSEPVTRNIESATNRVGFPIPEGGHRRRLATERIMLAGDAAGFVDSLYGEGIAYAIRSGALAARAIHSSRAPARRYTTWCNHEIMRPLRYSRWFAAFLHKYPGVLLQVFATTPEVLQKFLHVPARKSSYGDFVRWLLPRLPIFLAKQFLFVSPDRRSTHSTTQ